MQPRPSMMDKHEPDTAPALAMSKQEAEAFRAALQRVIDSEAFAGSRRMSAFLQFAGQAALEGRTEIDQYEIAEQVLHRHEDFNPLDDASVRKLASQVRSKLEEYYEGEGAAEPLVISLPRRSYVLRFRYRTTEAGAAEPASNAARALKAWMRFPWRLALGAAALLGAGVWLGMQVASRPAALEASQPAPILIQTQRGDLRGAPLDVAADAVRLGPVLEPGDEVVAELTFVPENVSQQAGVMAFGGPDHFVRFGQHFKDRAMLEQSYEVNARPSLLRSHFLVDPQGQSGRARWLALRREGSRYSAYLSADAFTWTSFAAPLEVPGLPEVQRAGIYAFNGRSDGPAAVASFRSFRTGPAFHNRPDGAFRAEAFPGWRADTECGAETSASIERGALQVEFAPLVVGCSWYFTRQAPEGDWTYAALLDFLPASGSSAGLVLRNTVNGNIHLSRRHFHTNILTLERTHDEDQRISDFPGMPPVILRLDVRDGILSASASRDGRQYVPVASGIRLAGPREKLRIGLYTMIAHWTAEAPRPPARFHWVQRLVEAPETLKQAGFR